MALWIKTERALWMDRYVLQFSPHDRIEVIGIILTIRMLINCEGDGEYTLAALLLRMQEYHEVTLAQRLLSESGFFQVDRDNIVTICNKTASRTHAHCAHSAHAHASTHPDAHAPVLDLRRTEQSRTDNTYNPLLSSLMDFPEDKGSQESVETVHQDAEIPELYKPYQDYPWFPTLLEIALPEKELSWRESACMNFPGHSKQLLRHWTEFMAFFMNHLASEGNSVTSLTDAKHYVMNVLHKPQMAERLNQKLEEWDGEEKVM